MEFQGWWNGIEWSETVNRDQNIAGKQSIFHLSRVTSVPVPLHLCNVIMFYWSVCLDQPGIRCLAQGHNNNGSQIAFYGVWSINLLVIVNPPEGTWCWNPWDNGDDSRIPHCRDQTNNISETDNNLLDKSEIKRLAQGHNGCGIGIMPCGASN